jgi:hypothetical protein
MGVPKRHVVVQSPPASEKANLVFLKEFQKGLEAQVRLETLISRLNSIIED